LQTQLSLNEGIPYTRNWSAAADFLQLIVDYCLQTKPALILECSSGLTTLMLARCCQINGQGRVVSLEDGAEFAANIRRYLDQYGLGQYAMVIHAPLQRVTLDDLEYAWYATDAIPDGIIEMLVIDGPSSFIQKKSRYPALPLLHSKLAQGCRVFLDDAARPDEQDTVALWHEKYPDLALEFIETERGCATLTMPA
jgi:predicted O-methyltransferase YrrM